jgi:hypothetical protein
MRYPRVGGRCVRYLAPLLLLSGLAGCTAGRHLRDPYTETVGEYEGMFVPEGRVELVHGKDANRLVFLDRRGNLKLEIVDANRNNHIRPQDLDYISGDLSLISEITSVEETYRWADSLWSEFACTRGRKPRS